LKYGSLRCTSKTRKSKRREQARTAVCQNNLKQIAIGFALYRNDYDGANVPFRYWTGGSPSFNTEWGWTLNTYLNNEDVFICPSRPEWYVKSVITVKFF